MKKYLVILILCLFVQQIIAQKETNLLKKHEISLLKLLLNDSVNNTNFTLNNNFNFGLDNQLFTSSNILKKGKDVYIQPLGTGRLYKAQKSVNGEIQLIRIDKTIHSGVSFFAQNFFVRDTLYQFGGLGFWQIRGILSFYSKQTNQWELIQTNRSIQSYFDDQKDAMMHLNDKDPEPKLFVSNSYYYPNYPSSFEIQATDSCFMYDFHSRQWSTLGKLTPEFKKIVDNKHSHESELHFDNLFVFQSQLEFYWIDFKNNKLGQFNTKENNRLRQVWLSLYNNDKTRLQTVFQFNLGQDIYFIKYDPGADLEWIKTPIDLNALDTINTIQIYNNHSNIIETTSQFYTKHKTSIFLLMFILLIGVGIRTNIFKRKRIPKEVIAILYQNFFISLSIVEKELIQALCQSNLKGEEVSTKTINKIIGVQQKDTLTQNKSRSDHFIKINQKFKMATQNSEPLVIKNRDKEDKRQYNYGLNELYITAIDKLFKD